MPFSCTIYMLSSDKPQHTAHTHYVRKFVSISFVFYFFFRSACNNFCCCFFSLCRIIVVVAEIKFSLVMLLPLLIHDFASEWVFFFVFSLHFTHTNRTGTQCGWINIFFFRITAIMNENGKKNNIGIRCTEKMLLSVGDSRREIARAAVMVANNELIFLLFFFWAGREGFNCIEFDG